MSEINPSDMDAETWDVGEENGERKRKALAKAGLGSSEKKKKIPWPVPKAENVIAIAVSSRALFNSTKEEKIYDNEGLEKYVAYQEKHEAEPLEPGSAFPFVKALMTVNIKLKQVDPDCQELFDIVLMTRNHAQVGVRLSNSINHHGLAIDRFCMTGIQSPIDYLEAYNTKLFLSNDHENVAEAIAKGIPAATMFTCDVENKLRDDQLRVAFDGDAVLFSDESEEVFKKDGMDAFFEHEKKFEDKPLTQGPLKCFLEALGKFQKKFYDKDMRVDCPIRTFLVTARGGASSGVRALKTLREWGLEMDEAHFLAGAPKGRLLKIIRPHIFFDDQMRHIDSAKSMGTIAAHVPYGVAQKNVKAMRQTAGNKK